MKRNNMGLGGFLLRVRAEAAAGRAKIEPTGQTFTLEGTAREGGGGASWRAFRVKGWEEPSRTRLEIID